MSHPKWPLTAVLSKLPESSWLDAMDAMSDLNLESDKNAAFGYGAIQPNQIRLLTLPPAAKHAPLEAVMFVCNFPKLSLDGWEALSYTWGDSAELARTIVINERKKKITTTLETALRYLRDEIDIKFLWVDALCIDQDNNKEKGHQLRLMRFIYEEAACVRVWLGEWEEHGEQAMIFLMFIQELNPDDDSIFNELYGKPESDTLASLTSLFSRPYWRRVWIIQELVCASRPVLHCGNLSVEWPTVLRVQTLFSKWSRESRTPRPTNPRNRMQFALSPAYSTLALVETIQECRRKAEHLKQIDKKTALLGLLWGMDDCEASNPKDRIYSLLGLVEDVNLQHEVFPIDYSLRDEQVYIDAAKYTITVSERLEILSLLRPGQRLRSKYKLPSWCPDWTLDLRRTNRLIDENMRNSCIASGDTVAKSRFPLESNALIVSGVKLGIIEILGGEFGWDRLWWFQYLALTQPGEQTDRALALLRDYSPSEQEKIARWVQISSFGDPKLNASMEGQVICSCEFQRRLLVHLNNAVPKLRDDPIIDARLDLFWRAITTEGRAEDAKNTCGLETAFNAFMGWRDPRVPENAYHGQAGAEFTHPFRRKTARYAHGRQFFITSDRRFGLAPYDAQKDDIVCVLLGYGCPVTLRPEGDHYLVVGETYLYGYMRGEAINEMSEGILKEEEFVLH